MSINELPLLLPLEPACYAGWESSIGATLELRKGRFNHRRGHFRRGCGSGIGLLPGINGCTGFGTNPTHIVTFGEGVSNVYDPRCLQVAEGQSVMWNGNFRAHTLQPGVGAICVSSNGLGCIQGHLQDPYSRRCIRYGD